jgi:phosphosulfolactate synthase
MGAPFRLDVPVRTGKPRRTGLTHVLDKGMPVALAAEVLETCGPYVDVWKFGWGTAYLDPGLTPKLALLADHHVLGCVGGTLLEVAWAQRRVDDLLAWAAATGFPCVEVSRGAPAAAMGVADKAELIALAAARFTVFSEVGSKSPGFPAPAEDWAAEVAGDLDAGAAWVLAEGRESGTVGIFDESGEVREKVVDAVVAAAGIDRIVFEAPSKDQQAWFVVRYGPNVNLANIAPAEVLGLETLRLGLRADTMSLSCPVRR